MTLKNKLQNGLLLASGLVSALTGCGNDKQNQRYYVAQTPAYNVLIMETTPASMHVSLRAKEESKVPYEIIAGSTDGSWEGLTIGLEKGGVLGTIPFDKNGQPEFKLNATRLTLEEITFIMDKLKDVVEKSRKTNYEVDRDTYCKLLAKN